MLRVGTKSRIAIVIPAVLLGSLGYYYTNHIWIGETCAPNYVENCERGVPGLKSRWRFLTLEQCKRKMSSLGHAYICASGPDPRLPHTLATLSYRSVYQSETNRLEFRSVAPSLKLFGTGLAIGAALGLIGVLFTAALRRLIRKRSIENPN